MAITINPLVINPIPAPSFTFLSSTGEKPATFIHGFLSRQILSYSSPPPTIRANNGEIYQAVYDGVEDTAKTGVLDVIISFQSHTYGNFAIIRNYRPRPTPRRFPLPNGHKEANQ